jgi:uncharacterized repeat protein (TIGR03803 family)
MNTRNIFRLVALHSILLFATARAQTYSVVKEFSGSDGQGPVGPLVLSGSTLYGNTYLGGSSNYGTIFTMKTDGTSFSVLRNFLSPTHANGAIPSGNIILSGNTLFGTTEAGGGGQNLGTVFRMNTNGSGFSVIQVFGAADPNSARPRSGLVMVGTTLFGTTYGKSIPGGYGTLFRVSTNGNNFLAMLSFNPALFLGDGSNPYTGLTASGTNLYGTTYSGGTSGNGTIFRLGTNGGFAYLKNFSGSDGANPRTPLLLAGNTLFGMTINGGASSLGTIYKLNTNGTGYLVLKHFSGSDGSSPLGSLLLVSNYLYGTTYSGGAYGLGTLFRIHTNGSGFSVIKDFSGLDGDNPSGGLVRVGNNLYGTTYAGGSSGNGLIFALDLAPIITITNLGDSVELNWNATAGLEYQVQFKTNLNQSAWGNLGGTTTSSGTTATATDSVETGERRFYRVLLLH